MTNKENALEQLYTNTDFADTFRLNDVVMEQDDISDLIKLASKPDWYFPSNGEFPKYGLDVWCKLDMRDYPDYAILRYVNENVWMNENNDIIETVVSFTYLPKFEE